MAQVKPRSTRGGKRPGAGRPRSKDKPVTLSVRVSRAQHARILSRTDKNGETVAEFLRRVVSKELTPRPGEGTRRRLARQRA